MSNDFKVIKFLLLLIFDLVIIQDSFLKLSEFLHSLVNNDQLGNCIVATKDHVVKVLGRISLLLVLGGLQILPGLALPIEIVDSHQDLTMFPGSLHHSFLFLILHHKPSFFLVF